MIILLEKEKASSKVSFQPAGPAGRKELDLTDTQRQPCSDMGDMAKKSLQGTGKRGHELGARFLLFFSPFLLMGIAADFISHICNKVQKKDQETPENLQINQNFFFTQQRKLYVKSTRKDRRKIFTMHQLKSSNTVKCIFHNYPDLIKACFKLSVFNLAFMLFFVINVLFMSPCVGKPRSLPCGSL